MKKPKEPEPVHYDSGDARDDRVLARAYEFIGYARQEKMGWPHIEDTFRQALARIRDTEA